MSISFNNTNSDMKISVIVPTMWMYDGFIPFINQVADAPGIEVIIIDNNVEKRPTTPLDERIRIINMPVNIGVNPAWNLGIREANNNYICLLNDDLEFDFESAFRLVRENGLDNCIIGLCPGDPYFNQVPVTTEVAYINHNPLAGEIHHNQLFGFGQLMFLNRLSYIPIPSALKYYYGDNLIITTAFKSHQRVKTLENLRHKTPCAQTTSKVIVDVEGTLRSEGDIYNEYIKLYHTNALQVEYNFNQKIKSGHKLSPYLDILFSYALKCRSVLEYTTSGTSTSAFYMAALHGIIIYSHIRDRIKSNSHYYENYIRQSSPYTMVYTFDTWLGAKAVAGDVDLLFVDAHSNMKLCDKLCDLLRKSCVNKYIIIHGSNKHTEDIDKFIREDDVPWRKEFESSESGGLTILVNSDVE